MEGSTSKKRTLNRTTFHAVRLSDFQNHTIMNKRLTVQTLSFLLIATMMTFSACVKDRCKQEVSYTYYQPVYKTKSEVRANIKSNSPTQMETTGKIYIRGNYIFLNEVDKGIHVINNSNPSMPENVAFIDIPGNMDMAVKGNILYADLYTDLVALDIADPMNVKVKKIIEGVFPHRYWGGGFAGPAVTSDQIVTEWIKRDTIVASSCDQVGWNWGGRTDVFLSSVRAGSNSGTGGSASVPTTSPIGAGGSMARFTIMNERLYTVSWSDLGVFDIANLADPQHTNTISIGGWNIETIYPFKDKLFIGSRAGMYIYNVTNADAPAPTGQFQHASSCDPVIADDNYAYVTLRSGTECEGFTNQLEIVNLKNISNPVLEKTYPMKNPHGLSKDGDLLFICDGAAGLKLYDAADVLNLQLLNEVNDIETFDVIAMNNIALVVSKDGLYQYSYADLPGLRLLSKITIGK